MSTGLLRATQMAIVTGVVAAFWVSGALAPPRAGELLDHGRWIWASASSASGVRCDLFASPSGSDSGDGSFERPLLSLRRLDEQLVPGQTGCLRGGSYGALDTQHELTRIGDQSHRITITSYPGESATVIGWVALEGSYTTLSHLNIDGSNTLYRVAHPLPGCPSVFSRGLSISGSADALEYDNYYQSVAALRSNGIGVGWNGSGDNTVIRFNKIHDVGLCQAFDHLIYLAHGNNVQIYGNWMWNDPHGWGVQLYPAPTNARVFDNVIDAAGAGFTVGNEPGDVVSGNRIWNNVVMNSTGLPSAHLPGVAISDSWGGVPGRDNVFTGNDSYNNPGGISRTSNVSVVANTTANPQLIDPANHDYGPRLSTVGSQLGLAAR